MFESPNMHAKSPKNGAVIATPGNINKNGMPNDFELEAGLKQCMVIIPVIRISTAFTTA